MTLYINPLYKTLQKGPPKKSHKGIFDDREHYPLYEFL